MSKILEARQISKKYSIYHQQGYSTLVDSLSSSARNLIARLKSPQKKCPSKQSCEELWALRDISFDLERGDRLGIIGKNGAGKSTLLKIFSRITHPTAGTIKVRGRVASLLEVGTGFHPELTGRENIFLNGAILGMSEKEIRHSFDAIVSFAEIEKFLDTPVKRFSSGMHTRLGFAIAAHLNPDLLILDEVLAVGDSQFQEKCLRKLRELEQHGRTIIFVSHDLSALMNFCNKGIFLEKGLLKESGSIEACVDAYTKTWQQCDTKWNGHAGDHNLIITEAALIKSEQYRDFYYQDERVRIEFDYEILRAGQDINLGISVCNRQNQLLARTTILGNHQMERFSLPGKHKAIFEFDVSLLHPGEYWVKIDAALNNAKWITSDDIILKLNVYSRQDSSRFSTSHDRSGVTLGNAWQIA